MAAKILNIPRSGTTGIVLTYSASSSSCRTELKNNLSFNYAPSSASTWVTANTSTSDTTVTIVVSANNNPERNCTLTPTDGTYSNKGASIKIYQNGLVCDSESSLILHNSSASYDKNGGVGSFMFTTTECVSGSVTASTNNFFIIRPTIIQLPSPNTYQCGFNITENTGFTRNGSITLYYKLMFGDGIPVSKTFYITQSGITCNCGAINITSPSSSINVSGGYDNRVYAQYSIASTSSTFCVALSSVTVSCDDTSFSAWTSPSEGRIYVMALRPNKNTSPKSTLVEVRYRPNGQPSDCIKSFVVTQAERICYYISGVTNVSCESGSYNFIALNTSCNPQCSLSLNGPTTHIYTSTAITDSKEISFLVTSKYGDFPSAISTFTATSIPNGCSVSKYTVTQQSPNITMYLCKATVNGLSSARDYTFVFSVVNNCGESMSDITFVITKCTDMPSFNPQAITNEPSAAHTVTTVYTKTCGADISDVIMQNGIFSIQSSATSNNNVTFTISLPAHPSGALRQDTLYVIDSYGRARNCVIQQNSGGGTSTSGKGRCKFLDSHDPLSNPSSSVNNKLTIQAPWDMNGTQAQLDALLNALDTSQSVSMVWKYVKRADTSQVIASYTHTLSYSDIKNNLTLARYTVSDSNAYKLYEDNDYNLHHSFNVPQDGQGYSLELTVSNLPTNMFNQSTFSVVF